MSYTTIPDSMVAAFAPMSSRLVTRLQGNQQTEASQHFALRNAITAEEGIWNDTWAVTPTEIPWYFPTALAGEDGTRIYIPYNIYVWRNTGAGVDGTVSARLYHADSASSSNVVSIASNGEATTQSDSGYFTLDLSLSASGFSTIELQTKGVKDAGVPVPSSGIIELPSQKVECCVHRLPAEGY